MATPLVCKYSDMGCVAQFITVADLDRHYHDEAAEHLELAVRALAVEQSMKEHLQEAMSNAQTRCRKNEQEIARLHSEISKIQSQLEKTKDQLRNVSKLTRDEKKIRRLVLSFMVGAQEQQRSTLRSFLLRSPIATFPVIPSGSTNPQQPVNKKLPSIIAPKPVAPLLDQTPEFPARYNPFPRGAPIAWPHLEQLWKRRHSQPEDLLSLDEQLTRKFLQHFAYCEAAAAMPSEHEVEPAPASEPRSRMRSITEILSSFRGK